MMDFTAQFIIDDLAPLDIDIPHVGLMFGFFTLLGAVFLFSRLLLREKAWMDNL
tara:strand:+ start:431 stop:592 length:162 start_codon:yes stop_codon:yes gene_type:complete